MGELGGLSGQGWRWSHRSRRTTDGILDVGVLAARGPVLPSGSGSRSVSVGNVLSIWVLLLEAGKSIGDVEASASEGGGRDGSLLIGDGAGTGRVLALRLLKWL